MDGQWPLVTHPSIQARLCLTPMIGRPSHNEVGYKLLLPEWRHTFASNSNLKKHPISCCIRQTWHVPCSWRAVWPPLDPWEPCHIPNTWVWTEPRLCIAWPASAPSLRPRRRGRWPRWNSGKWSGSGRSAEIEKSNKVFFFFIKGFFS